MLSYVELYNFCMCEKWNIPEIRTSLNIMEHSFAGGNNKNLSRISVFN